MSVELIAFGHISILSTINSTEINALWRWYSQKSWNLGFKSQFSMSENIGIFLKMSKNFSFLFMSKLFLDFQSKYNFQSDLSYHLKQERYAQRPPSYTGGRCRSSSICATILCCEHATSPVLEQDRRSWILVKDKLANIARDFLNISYSWVNIEK